MKENKRDIEDIRIEIENLKSEAGWLYAGLPKFKSLFGRDSIISSLQLIEYDETIAIKTLAYLSETQGLYEDNSTYEEPGKIIHEIHKDAENINKRQREVQWLKSGKNYFSVDSTPLFIILLTELINKQKSFRQVFLPNLKRAIRWMVDYGITGKYLSYNRPPEGVGPQSMSWRDGIGSILNTVTSPVAVLGVQSYAYEALNRGLKFLGSDDESDLKEKIKMDISLLKDRTYSDFTDEGETFPGIAIGGDGVLTDCITSEPGHLIFSGILNREQERSIIDRLFDEDLLTPYGIRTISTLDHHFDSKAYQRGAIWPNDNWIIAYGLRKRGYLNEYNEIKKRMLECSEHLGGLPEFIGVDRDNNIIPRNLMRIEPCYPQAWSTGTEYYFLTH